jgi:hypothetical protein
MLSVPRPHGPAAVRVVVDLLNVELPGDRQPGALWHAQAALPERSWLKRRGQAPTVASTPSDVATRSSPTRDSFNSI